MKKKHLHILGICGTAMAAIANLSKERGFFVTGSDSGIYPPMSDYLDSLAIVVQPFNESNLNPAPDLCVIGNAMSRGNIEVEAILNRGLPYCSGPEFIGNYILPNRHAIVVAGTHGKTTTSSIMAHLLEVAGKAPGFLIGGIPENFEGGARVGSGESFVLEGDEYDTAFFDKRSKFLHYHARTLILNNLEFDHADIFPDLEAIKLQFSHLLRTLPANGNIIVNADDANLSTLLEKDCWTPITTFSAYISGEIDSHWQWEALTEDGSAFRLYHHGKQVIETKWKMIGTHNITNACGAAAAATLLGISYATIKTSFASFAGIRRRMTLIGEVNNIRIFDDFAHHPTAIQSVVSAAKAAMSSASRRSTSIKPEGRLWVIVEPASNTMRSNIHQDRLSNCFAAADRIIFLPASDRNMQVDKMLDTELLCRAIGDHAESLEDVDSIIAYLIIHARSGDDILILSNGSFGNIHQKLLEGLNS